MKIKIFSLLLCFFLFTIVSCGKGNKNDVREQKGIDDSFSENIKTTKVVLRDQEKSLTLTGKVEYDPDHVISYTPLISGVVDRTYFSLGDKVQKGQNLMDVRSPELSSMQTGMIMAESEIKIAERDFKTVSSLFDDNMVSEKELLEAKARLAQATAALKKIQLDMQMYGFNNEAGSFFIKAPISGYIVSRNVSSGSTISNDGGSVFTIADLSTVWITANVYAGNLLFVKEGQEVDITTLSYPDEVFKAKITSLSQVFDPDEKVLKARILMKNDGLKFKPEMSVVVKLKGETDRQMVSVPSDALVFDDNSYFVVIKNSENQFEIREVILDSSHNGVSYIRSGISAGEDIVTKNQLLLYSELK